MDPAPVVSVVVPTRNRAALLETCLVSLLQQGLAEPYEVLVIDDGSTDETCAVVGRVRARAARPERTLGYDRQAAQGINAARNRGVHLSRADLVIMVDDDVETPAGWLRALLEGAAAHPEADAFGGPILLRMEAAEPRHCHADRLPETHLDRGPEPVWGKPLYGANLGFRKRCFDLAGAFDESMGAGDEEEWEDRLIRAGGRLLYLPDGGLWHRRTADELRRGYLIRRTYRRGYSHVPYLLASGVEVSAAREAWLALRGLGHACLLGCFYGLLRACLSAGKLHRLGELSLERARSRRR